MIVNHEALVRYVIAERLNNRFLFVYEWESWLEWDSARWAPIPRVNVRGAIGDWAHRNYIDASNKDARKWATICSYSSQEALTELAEHHLLKHAHEFDANPFLLNCQNLTVNLQSGSTHAHDPADLLTRVTPVSYIEGARHSDWSKVMTALPEELWDWIQLRMGQAITGRQTPDGKIIFFLGSGRNGKSAFVDTIQFALGSREQHGYSLRADRSILSSKAVQPGSANPAKAALEGMRLAIVEELEDTHHLSATALKDLADTAIITAREVYAHQHEFEAVHSLFVTSNTTPSLTDTDDGSWRRPEIVRFPYKYAATNFPTEMHREPDDTLKDRLRGTEQLEAVLAYLVEGAVAYHTDEGYKRFLDIPRVVRANTEGWRADTDIFTAYIKSFLIFDPTRAAPRQRRGRHRGQRAAQHHRPAHVCDRHRRGPGHRVGHDPLQRSLPQLTREQPEQEALLVRGGPAEQLPDQSLAFRRRTLPAHRSDRRKPRVHLAQRKRRDLSRREPVPQRRPPHPDLPLRQLTRQVRDRDRHLGRPGLAQRARQQLHLRQPRTGRAYLPRHLRNPPQQHPSILAGPPSLHDHVQKWATIARNCSRS